jgi:hypothetical protein
MAFFLAIKSSSERFYLSILHNLFILLPPCLYPLCLNQPILLSEESEDSLSKFSGTFAKLTSAKFLRVTLTVFNQFVN